MFAETACIFRHAILRDAAYQLQLPGETARLWKEHAALSEGSTRAVSRALEEGCMEQAERDFERACRRAGVEVPVDGTAGP